MKKEITRYNHCGKENGFIVCRGMGESENGKYILYADYLKLKNSKKSKITLMELLDDTINYARKERKKILKSLRKDKK